MGDARKRAARSKLGEGHPSRSRRTLTLVLDASAALWLTTPDVPADALGDALVGPPLLWSEVASVLHARAWRGTMSREDARAALMAFLRLDVAWQRPDALQEEAWALADELGWAKTYDAEYLALARLLGCRVVTLDIRLHRGAARTGLVVEPNELTS